MPSRNWQFAKTPSWMDFITPGCTPNTRKDITHWWKCAAWKFLDINKKINMLQAPKLWEMNKASICVLSRQILGNLLIKQKPNTKIYHDLTNFNTCTHSSRIFAGMFLGHLDGLVKALLQNMTVKLKSRPEQKQLLCNSLFFLLLLTQIVTVCLRVHSCAEWAHLGAITRVPSETSPSKSLGQYCIGYTAYEMFIARFLLFLLNL